VNKDVNEANRAMMKILDAYLTLNNALMFSRPV